MEIWGDILSDPEVKKSVSDLIHVLWHYKVQPKIQDTIDITSFSSRSFPRLKKRSFPLAQKLVKLGRLLNRFP